MHPPIWYTFFYSIPHTVIFRLWFQSQTFSLSLLPMVVFLTFCLVSWNIFTWWYLCEHRFSQIYYNACTAAPVISVSSHFLQIFWWRHLLLPFHGSWKIGLWWRWLRFRFWLWESCFCGIQIWYPMESSHRGLERIRPLKRTLFRISLSHSIPLDEVLPMVSDHQWYHQPCFSLATGSLCCWRGWRLRWVGQSGIWWICAHIHTLCPNHQWVWWNLWLGEFGKNLELELEMVEEDDVVGGESHLGEFVIISGDGYNVRSDPFIPL